MPAVTEPPGELMYSQMSRSGSSPSRYRSCAVMRLAMASSTSEPRNTMRLRSRRLNTSFCGSPKPPTWAISRSRDGSGVMGAEGSGATVGSLAGVLQLAERPGLGPGQCGFDSHRRHPLRSNDSVEPLGRYAPDDGSHRRDLALPGEVDARGVVGGGRSRERGVRR